MRSPLPFARPDRFIFPGAEEKHFGRLSFGEIVEGGRSPANAKSAPTCHHPEPTASNAVIAPCETPTKATLLSRLSKSARWSTRPMTLSKAALVCATRSGLEFVAIGTEPLMTGDSISERRIW